MAKGWYFRGNTAVYDFEVNGQRYRGSLKIKKNSGIVDGKTPEERADMETRNLMVNIENRYSIEAIWEQTQRKLAGTKTINATFEDIWNYFSTVGMSTPGERRKILYIGHLKEFCTWISEKHTEVKTVAQITESIAKEYITNLYSLPGAPATKNDKLTTLKMIFNNLELAVNPFSKIKKMAVTQIQREIFTPAQIKILFEKSTGWMRTLFITALATFQREEDCCLIKKSYIRLDTNRIKFPFTFKTGQEIKLPMLPLFRQIVEEALAAENDSEYLFPELAEIYQKNSSYIGKKVKQFFEENDFSGTTVEVQGYKRKVSVLDVHSLRHTAAVMAVLSGWPISMVMKATGHRSLQMVMRYINHISEEQKENYFFQFGKGLPDASLKKRSNVVLPYENTSMYLKDESRDELAGLAYALPLEEVKRILALVKPITLKAKK